MFENTFNRLDQRVKFIDWCEIFNTIHHVMRAICNYPWLAIKNGSEHYSRGEIGFCGPLIKSPFQLFSSWVNVITVRMNGFDKIFKNKLKFEIEIFSLHFLIKNNSLFLLKNLLLLLKVKSNKIIKIVKLFETDNLIIFNFYLMLL